ncbi:putative transmembrane protein [Toxoplasma gondii VAND]|uniref:Putative transmembrane protein n=1 Tax=Toxoplasma gondii VAND TaxID=933077 RepID=A0A086PP81_TOXGO|nr:putative transmembrane protein [Toxoplasma gondii VAND]
MASFLSVGLEDLPGGPAGDWRGHLAHTSPVLVAILLAMLALLGVFSRLLFSRPLRGFSALWRRLATWRIQHGFGSRMHLADIYADSEPDLEGGLGVGDAGVYVAADCCVVIHSPPAGDINAATDRVGSLLFKGEEPSTPSESWSTTESAGGANSLSDDEDDDLCESGDFSPRFVDRLFVRPAFVPELDLRSLKRVPMQDAEDFTSAIGSRFPRSGEILGIATY